VPARRCSGHQRAPPAAGRTTRTGPGLTQATSAVVRVRGLARARLLSYRSRVATPGVPTGDELARASDSLQAAYFRGVLADQRALTAAEIARQNRKLSFLSARTDPLAISRLRREIRSNEADHHHLDRMIEAIDRRFSPGWADMS